MVDIIMCLREPLNLYKHHVLFNTHFSSSSDLFSCSALARTMTPMEVRPLWFRLQWDNTLELDHISCFCCYGNDNSSPEEPMIMFKIRTKT